MKIGIRAKRNLQLVLTIIGIACMISRTWEVVLAPSSGRAWFELFGITVLTYLSFDGYLDYNRKCKE